MAGDATPPTLTWVIKPPNIMPREDEETPQETKRMRKKHIQGCSEWNDGERQRVRNEAVDFQFYYVNEAKHFA